MLSHGMTSGENGNAVRRPRRNRRSSKPSQHLTKTKYCAGLQCEKRLWLAVNARELSGEIAPATRARFDLGSEIGVHAHKLFPGGVVVDHPPWKHAAAVARTRALMEDPSVPAIFEAAFEYDGVRIRADVLERLGQGEWGLREVKMSGGVKPEHLPDVVVQHYVLEGCGLRVTSAQPVHVNTAYVRGPGDVDWPQYFSRAELIGEIELERDRVAERVRAFREVVALAEAPDVRPGVHCRRPYECEFIEHCHAGLPDDWVARLPRVTPARVDVLLDAGYVSISDIPLDSELSTLQARVRDCHVSGQPFVGDGLASALEPGGPPAFYLDFETMNPAIPLYPGTRPYQTLPFQWSLHRLGAGGDLSHVEFLAAGAADPRREFVESLLEAVGDSEEPVHVYSAFETTRLGELATEFPDLAPPIEQLRARLFDLLPVVQNHLYYREFRCSWSIKTVAPALCPDLTYDDLVGISDGESASLAMVELARGRTEGPDAARIRRALLEYCERDTLAMVELHRALRGLG